MVRIVPVDERDRRHLVGGVPFLVLFVLAVVVAYVLQQLGILPPLDLLPGEPVR